MKATETLHRRQTIALGLGILALLATTVVTTAQPSDGPGERKEFVVGLQDAQGHRPDDSFHGGRVLKVDSAIHYVVIESHNADDFQHRARADPNVRYIEENVQQNLLLQRESGGPGAAGGDVGAQFTPNDPSYATQYGPQQIRANLAWDTTLGDLDAAVCIVDTGVRYTHQEIAGSRWLGGHDFVNADTDPWDDNGHGTHVAGSAAASINNGVGIAGIGNVGIYGVKVLNSGGGGTWEGVASGITWCADNTMARTVISMSLGGSAGAQVLQDAVSYAYSTKGRLIVAASGNDFCVGAGCILYPAQYAEVMAVGCTNNLLVRCAFSNGGPDLEIVAPGQAILSSWNTADNAYNTIDGTSMSTPHVSGAAALVWSQVTGLSNTALRQRLRDTTEDLGPAGWDQEYGYGEVDAKCLLDGTGCSGGGGGGDVLWSENLDDGAANGFTLSGLWRITTCQSASAPNSLGYNTGVCPPNFNVGATSGDAITPSITIAAGTTNVKLNWKSWHQTEFGTTFDKKTVSISSDGGASWTQLQQEDGTQAAWNARTVDISGYAGSTVKVRFRFDSVDSVANDGQGWYVDDLSVTGTAPGAAFPYSETLDDGVANGFTLSGLWRITNCQSFSAPNSLGYNQGACPPNFNTGSTTLGDAITPAIAIPASAPAVELAWKSWHNTESGLSFDLKKVYITNNDGVTWTELHTEDGTQSTWNARTEDISSFKGSTVKIRFHFNSVDSIANTGQGWYVDSIQVQEPVAVPPSAPLGLDATPGPGDGQIRLTWNPPSSNGGAPITSYKIYEATASGGPYSWIDSVGGSTLTYTRSGLGDGVTRWYKVSAVNSAGEGPQSNVDGATTFNTPAAPQNVAANPGPLATTGRVDVTWSPPASNGGSAVTAYKVYRNDGAGYFLRATVSGSPFVDTGLSIGKTYRYKVSAVNIAGEGPQSSEVCTKPSPWVNLSPLLCSIPT